MAAEYDSDSGRDSLAEFLAMSVKGMILMAFVDGRLDWLERELLVDSLRAGGDYLTAEQVLSFLDSSAHTLEVVPEPYWPGLFEAGRHMSDESKRLLLTMFIRMGFADGHLSPGESHLIHQIADWMEIDRQSREVVKETARGAIVTAQERGVKYTGIENLDWKVY